MRAAGRETNMTRTLLVAIQVAALLGLAVTARADDDEKLAATLKAVVENNLRAYDGEDAAGTMGTIHTRSPQYDTTNAALAEQFRDFDLSTKVTNFRYMGHDDEFAVARVKIQVEGPSGSVFVNNTTDNLILFHQEGGLWKIWTDDVLGVEFEQRIGTVVPAK
jgi:hypothetical protein